VNRLSEGVAALMIEVPGRPVNVVTRQFLADLEAALDRLEAESAFKLLVIRSAREGSFLAGADVHELATVHSPDEAVQFSAAGQRVFDRLAALRLPSAAVISGSCLGGGLELALACDYRVLVDQPKTAFGFPEVELGLIPAWGGTQRLPRLVGLERALQMIVGARKVSAHEAVAWGLADELVDNKEEEPPACLAAPVKRTYRRLPLLTWRQRLLESTRLGRWLISRGTLRLLERRVPEDMPAQGEALEAVMVGLRQGHEAGQAYERAAVGRLAATPACRNLVELFLRREQLRKQQVQPAKKTAAPIRRVGVVGAGIMGAAIAELAVLKGCEVVVREANEIALGLAMLRVMALLDDAVNRGLLARKDLEKRLANVHGTTAWRSFADLDLAIEAVDENLKLKQSVFREMENHTSPSTVLVSNTSSLRVENLQEMLQYPARSAGLHFFNPANKTPLVEIVHTPQTRRDVLDSLTEWATRLGKTCVLVKDSPGFLVNRVLVPYLNEAMLLAGQGLRVALVDDAMRRFGMPVGPFELLDQIGLNVASQVAGSLAAAFGERFLVSPVFAQMKEMGWLGVKSGMGFYRYRRGKKTVHDQAEALLRREGQVAEMAELEPSTPRELMALASERMVGLMVNEAAVCLGEGLVQDEATLDLAMILGAGWAPHRGGPLRYARDRGITAVIDSLKRLAEQFGPRFQPSPALQRLASSPTSSV
jgi:3-hydroxyacyl-CoA dehydrogenase/enoyl-CoA hydratase/3-hydroxybutyryl-CoA epimerase